MIQSCNPMPVVVCPVQIPFNCQWSSIPAGWSVAVVQVPIPATAATVDSQNKNSTKNTTAPQKRERCGYASEDKGKHKRQGTAPAEKHRRHIISPEEMDKSLARQCDRLLASGSFAEW